MNLSFDFEKEELNMNCESYYPNSEEKLSINFNDNENINIPLTNDYLSLDKSELFCFLKEQYTMDASTQKSIISINNVNNMNAKDNKQNIKNLFIIKKEKLYPDAFLEEQINCKIKIMDMNKNMKLRLLLNIVNHNNIIEKIKIELNANSKKRKKRVNIGIKHSQQGRKKKNDSTKRDHNKYASDNIINKIKNIINRSLIIFINKLIKANNIKEDIKKIQYDFISSKKRSEENLELLTYTLKKYLSIDISSKYDLNKYPANYNKIVIEKLIIEENNKDIFDFIFNYLTIEDWLDIFIYKKELKDFKKYNLLENSQKNKIKNNLVRIDSYLNEIYQEDKIYFHIFCLLIYNLKRYLSIKEKRNRKKKDEN